MKTILKAILGVGFAVLAVWTLATISEMSVMLRDTLTVLRVTRDEVTTARGEFQEAIQDVKAEVKRFHLLHPAPKEQQQVQIAR